MPQQGPKRGPKLLGDVPGETQVLAQVATLYCTDAFQAIQKIQTTKITCGVRLNLESRMLEMDFAYSGLDPREIADIYQAYRTKKHYHRLRSGQFVDLDDSSLAHLSHLIEQLALKTDQIGHATVQLPMNRALYIDSLTREYTDFQVSRNKSFKLLVQDLLEPQDMEFDVPSHLQGTLRNYQVTGYKWLRTLDHYGFGGILADDMGLGKTLQVIALVYAARAAQAGHLPTLVVAPTSLVYNWLGEVEKFAPDLKVQVISGTQSSRIDQFPDMSKAVKQIKAQAYFALTGTPIENTLTELWSIFDFIMPGYLHNHHQFVKRFENPIVKNGDSQQLKELSRHIQPFILRRMKKEVLQELPDKIESKMSSEMTPEQGKVYAAYLMQAQKEINSELAQKGFEKSQVKILSILTRLRQICCHPATFLENYHGGSGKVDQLMELVTDALDAQHRLLIFSQFTSLLELVQQKLTHAGIPFHYIDGATPAKDRMAQVTAFNQGQHNVFLISLKAGGTGLNLTGAYRLGQTKAVQVFKLVDSVIQPGEHFVSKLTEDEVRALFK